jgi:protein-L-isoaspartate(D-aspartate) O-methyltransferase
VTDLDEAVRQRARMVERDLVPRGIQDPAVLAAMAAVPREAFLPEALQDYAYDDGALPIGQDQTISQPYIVAAMAQAAEVSPGDRVLEVGTGSGYGGAVLRHLTDRVVTVERRPTLAREAAERLDDLGLGDVAVIEGDGSLGWLEGAPYDAIVVTAAGPVVPEALRDQLADGGRLVMPLGPRHRAQRLVRLCRSGEDVGEDDLGAVAFVPLVGEEGWPEPT